MSKLFIVEGPDCSGKSTLAKRICLERKAAYMHAAGNKAFHLVMLPYHLSMIASAKVMLANDMDVVFDRHWPSEWCYGGVLRPETSNRVYDVHVVFQELPLDTTYIFCGDMTDGLRRHQACKDPDHPYSDNNFLEIMYAYEGLYEDMKTWNFITQLHKYSINQHGHEMKKFINSL